MILLLFNGGLYDMILREYQQRSIDMLYDWFRNNDGNPCLMLPTGSGKSHIIAALCKDAVQNYPETKILMLTHVKELIEQNAEKMIQHWPDAPLGIYSAGVGKKQAGEPITFAGIQSVRNRAWMIGHIDLVIVDECHLISHKNEGGYRKLINELKEINANIRVIGLTATPYRLSHGLITDGSAIFDDIIEPVSIEELIHKGYLAPLKSKLTSSLLNTDGVHKRGGEYIDKELQKAVDTDANNTDIVREVLRLAGDRKSWLFFCAGVKHAKNVSDLLNACGVSAECITGETGKKDRERIIDDYKAGKITALTNANVLTTGFDYPDIDLIAMLRPTMSPGLYVQMAGRGMRIKSHTDHCLVLDFAGVVSTHGPITNVISPASKSENKPGEAPVKVCDQCNELVHPSVKICPECGYEFPPPMKKKMTLHDDDIMGIDNIDMIVNGWAWNVHTSKASGKKMLLCTYYGGLSDKPIKEYLTVLHEGYAGKKAVRNLADMAMKSGAEIFGNADLSDDEWLRAIAERMTSSNHPESISYKQNGKFYDIKKREWSTV